MAAWSYFPRVETSATWGFSFLLMPAALFGQSAMPLKIWSAALLLAGTLLFYRSIRGWLSPAATLFYILALYFNNFYLAFSGNVISEAGYILIFGGLAYLAIERQWLWKSTTAQTVMFGVLTGLLILTRVIGAALFLAVLLEMGLSRRLKEAIRYFIFTLATAAPYFLASKLCSDSYTYHAAGWTMWTRASSLPAILMLLMKNAYYYAKGLALLTFINFPSFLPNILWLKIPVLIAIVAIVGLGAVRCAQIPQRRWLLIYFLIYLLVCIAWPYQAPRFAIPIYPVFLLLFLSGFTSILRESQRRPALVVMAALVVFTNMRAIIDTVRTSLAQPPDISHQSHLWLKDHSSADDLVISMDIARICYYAGRRGLHFIPSESVESFVRRARQLKARYFFLKDAGYVGVAEGLPDFAKIQHDRLAEYLSHSEFFNVVYTNKDEGVQIFTLRPNPLPS